MLYASLFAFTGFAYVGVGSVLGSRTTRRWPFPYSPIFPSSNSYSAQHDGYWQDLAGFRILKFADDGLALTQAD